MATPSLFLVSASFPQASALFIAIPSKRMPTPLSSFLCSILPLHSLPSFPPRTLIDFPTPLCSSFCFSSTRFSYSWDMVAHWLRRRRSTGGEWVRIPLQPPCRDLGQVLYLQLPVAFRRVYSDTVSIAVFGSASERLRL